MLRRDTRAGGDTVDMDGAGAAQRHAAAELRSSHPQHVSQDPQKWGVLIDVDLPVQAVDLDLERHVSLRAETVTLSTVGQFVAGSSLLKPGVSILIGGEFTARMA
jgi:hypothetical protein